MAKKFHALEDKYYSINEVAEIMNVRYMTVSKMIGRGELKAFKLHRQYRIPESALLDLMNESASKLVA